MEEINEEVVNKRRAEEPQPTATGLLNLPQELRDQIYAFIIFPYNPTKDRWGNTYQSHDRHLPALDGYTNCTEWAPPGLSHVSRQVRSEVLDLWYSKANFVFHFRIPQTLDVMRKAMKHLEATKPDAVLKHFYVNWRTLSVGWIEPFVGFAQVFGVHKRHLPDCPIMFGTEWMDLRDSLPMTCQLLQDLINMGQGLDAITLKDRVAIREAILMLLTSESGDVELDEFRTRTRVDWEDKQLCRDHSAFRRATE